MNWYNIELEIPFYGKEFELIKASNEQEANLIAIKKIVRKYKCSDYEVLVTSCRVIKD